MREIKPTVASQEGNALLIAIVLLTLLAGLSASQFTSQMKNLQQADFYSTLYPEAQIASLETVSDTTFEGSASYGVKVTTTWGETYHEFFDKESGLLVGTTRAQASPMGNVEVVTVVSDWRDVEGLRVPFRSVQRTMGIEQVITVSSVDVMAVADSVFALPPEIAALKQP